MEKLLILIECAMRGVYADIYTRAEKITRMKQSRNLTRPATKTMMTFHLHPMMILQMMSRVQTTFEHDTSEMK